MSGKLGKLKLRQNNCFHIESTYREGIAAEGSKSLSMKLVLSGEFFDRNLVATQMAKKHQLVKMISCTRYSSQIQSKSVSVV